MNSSQIEGRRPVLEALRAGREITDLFVAAGTKAGGVMDDIVKLAKRQGVRVTELPRREIEERAQSRNAQGVIAMGREFGYVDVSVLLGIAKQRNEAAMLVALDGVTDPQNLGAIARSAGAAGSHGLIVPRRRAAPVTAAAEKASAGALEHVAVAQVANLTRTFEDLKPAGVWIVALDADATETIYDFDPAGQGVCLVIGGEGGGVSHLVRERADQVVRIPMSGRVASLNASAAAAVALFELARRRSS